MHIHSHLLFLLSPPFSFSLLSLFQPPCTCITSLPIALSSLYFNILTSPYVTCFFSSLLPSLFFSLPLHSSFFTFSLSYRKKKIKMEKENNLIMFGLPKTERGQGHFSPKEQRPHFLFKLEGKLPSCYLLTFQVQDQTAKCRRTRGRFQHSLLTINLPLPTPSPCLPTCSPLPLPPSPTYLAQPPLQSPTNKR